MQEDCHQWNEKGGMNLLEPFILDRYFRWEISKVSSGNNVWPHDYKACSNKTRIL